MRRLDGVIPVLPIPFHQDETIDEDSFRRTVEFVASSDVGGTCLPAYYSEFYKLTEAEREWCVGTAIEVTQHRIPIIAQANHGSARVAAQLAKRYEALGADVISFALPRQFALRDDALLSFAGSVADAVSIPILVQDYNPGGRTIDAEFIATLHKQHNNVLYVKLEEPLLIDKLADIGNRVGNAVSVFEGWGGYYMLEALTMSNCAGIMPGVPIADLLSRVFRAHRHGGVSAAYDLFAPLLPFISFELQNFELFLQVEKRLLVRRGLFQQDTCRAPTLAPSVETGRYVDLLCDKVLSLLPDAMTKNVERRGASPPTPHILNAVDHAVFAKRQ